MIQVNLTYADGATLSTETASVQDLLDALKFIGNPAQTPLFLYVPTAGNLPLKIDGLKHDPDVTLTHFQLVSPELGV